MGWKGTLRSVRAANNRAQREKDKSERALSRDLNKIDKNLEQVLRKATALEKQLERDPIKALGIRFSKELGFEGESFNIETDLFEASVSLVAKGYTNESLQLFSPPDFVSDNTRVRPLGILSSQWATFVAVEVEHDDPDLRLRTSWVKKSDPQSSAVYIVDEVGSHYYYPFATTLSGEVVAGHPRIGIIAFERFTEPTNSVSLHFSGVKLSKGRTTKKSFQFSSKLAGLAEDISRSLSEPSFADQVEETMTDQVKQLREQVKSQHSGCLLPFLLGSGIFFASLVLSVFLW